MLFLLIDEPSLNREFPVCLVGNSISRFGSLTSKLLIVPIVSGHPFWFWPHLSTRQ